MPVSIKDLKTHSDNRGFVFEPLDPLLFKDQKNVHVDRFHVSQ